MKRACKDLLKTWKKLEEGDKGGKEEISSSKKEEELQVKEPAKDKVKQTDFFTVRLTVRVDPPPPFRSGCCDLFKIS